MTSQQKLGLGVMVFLGGAFALLSRAPSTPQVQEAPPAPEARPEAHPRATYVTEAIPPVEVITPDGDRFTV